VDDELKNPIDESPEAPQPLPEAEPATESMEPIASCLPGQHESVQQELPVPPSDEEITISGQQAEPETSSEAPPLVVGDATEPAPIAAEPTELVADLGQPVAARAEPPVPVDQQAPAQEEPTEPAPAEPKSENMQWYILKVQSNREDSIRQGLFRRVKIAGLERFFGDIIIPIEKVTEVKGGRKRVIKRKLYPGYLVVQMEINDDTWFLVRETPGIGDFTGAAGRPTPMLPHEVARIVSTQEEKADAAPKLKIGFKLGDRVKINDGTFENFEGEVETIDEASGRVTVMINIFGRSTPVELEYWQVESL